jgi:hypothetical protein
VLTPLRGLGSVVRFQRGAVIFRERDHASALYVVISGGVALLHTTERWSCIIDFRFVANSLVLFTGRNTPWAPRPLPIASCGPILGHVDTLVDELPQFRRTLTGLFAEHVESGGDIAESHTARERIEAFLLSLSGRIADWSAANLPFSCDDIADRLDLSPAAVDCALRALNPDDDTARDTAR